MKQPHNTIFADRWSHSDTYYISVVDDDSNEYADIGHGLTKLSALRAASNRIARLSKQIDKLIEKETKD